MTTKKKTPKTSKPTKDQEIKSLKEVKQLQKDLTANQSKVKALSISLKRAEIDRNTYLYNLDMAKKDNKSQRYLIKSLEEQIENLMGDKISLSAISQQLLDENKELKNNLNDRDYECSDRCEEATDNEDGQTVFEFSGELNEEDAKKLFQDVTGLIKERTQKTVH